MGKRVVLRVKPKGQGWILTGPRYVLIRKRQRDAVTIGRRVGRRLWSRGRLAQLVLHGRSGRILWESTYGRDPERYAS